MDDRRRLAWIPLVAAGLWIAACGGGDDTDASTPTSSSSAPSATSVSDQPAATSETSDGPSSSPDENRAVVTIGDQTYEFTTDVAIVGRCDPDFFGAFWVSGTGVDDPSAGINMLLIPEGATNHSETSTITVNLKDSEGLNWRADEDGGEGATAGESRVTSFEIDGNTVSGTASFIDTYTLDSPTAEGTFTATCPG